MIIICLECQNAVEYDEPDYKPNYCDNCGVKYNG